MNELKNMAISLVFLVGSITLKGMHGRIEGKLISCDDKINAIAWHPSDRLLTLGCNGKIKYIDRMEYMNPYIHYHEWEKKIDDCDITSLAWNSHGTMLAAGGSNGLNGKVVILQESPLDDMSESSIQTHVFDRNVVCAIAWHPSESHIAVGLSNGGIEVFNTKNWDKLHTFTHATGYIRSLTWSPDGKSLAAKEVQIRYIEKDIKREFLIHKCDIIKNDFYGISYECGDRFFTSFAWRANGELVATSCFPGQSEIEYCVFHKDGNSPDDALNRSCDFLRKERKIGAIAYNPHLNCLVVGSKSGAMQLFTLEPEITELATLSSTGVSNIRLMEWHPHEKHTSLAIVGGKNVAIYDLGLAFQKAGIIT